MELIAALLKSLDTEYHSLIEKSDEITKRFCGGLREFFVGAREKVRIEENGGDRRCHRGSAMLAGFCKSALLRGCDSVERNGTGTMKDEDSVHAAGDRRRQHEYRAWRIRSRYSKCHAPART